MALGDRFKKFDLEKLRTFEKYEEAQIPTVKFSPTTPVGNFNKNIMTELQNALLEKVENIPVWFDYSAEKQQKLIENFFDNKVKNYPEYTYTENERLKITKELYSTVSGFGKLEYLLKQDNVSTVIVNNKNVSIEISDKILNADFKLNNKQLGFLLKNIYYKANISQNNNNNIINCRFDGFAISIINSNISTNGASVVIKKEPKNLGYNNLINNKFIPKDVAEFLISAIQGQKNIVIAGTSNCGKTYFIDNIIAGSLNSNRTAIIETRPQICSKSENFSNYSISNIDTKSEFLTVFNSILQTLPEYKIFDINNPEFFGIILDYVSSSDGNIVNFSAMNAENVMSKYISYLQSVGFSEKLAKSTFLSSIDYIIMLEKTPDNKHIVASITEVTPAKTATQYLKEIYNKDLNISSKTESIQPIQTDTSSIKTRFL